MKRPDGLIICDYHKRGGSPVWHGEVLDDGVTITPGYIEVTKDGVFELRSDDPKNEIAQAGILKNRHVDQNGNNLISRKSVDYDSRQIESVWMDTHFCNKECFTNYFKDK